MVVDLVLIGLAVTLFPLPIMAFVLVLASAQGLRKGLVFIGVWLVSLVAVIGIVVLLTGGQPPPPRSPPSRAAQVATLVIGVGLIGYAVYRRRRNRRDAAAPAAEARAAEEPESASDGVSFRSAAAFPLLLQPWGMVGAAAATVVQADLSDAGNVVALVGFCLLATSTLLAMELWMVFSPERAQRALTGLREWLARHKEPAIVGLCLLLGLWLVSRSLYLLTT
ncbi:GAP family protein [Streptomyces sp. NPDC085529]|uniref:GAP family protein n=1 Tax=Streptomyces sp. NPDC085529 TaxID=3365729 RepID=UPI0037CF4032